MQKFLDCGLAKITPAGSSSSQIASPNTQTTALVRMLYERLTTHDGLRNLVWTWEPATPGFGPGGNGGLADYYPGSLYADALTLDVESLAPSRFRGDVKRANLVARPSLHLAAIGQ